MTKRTLMMETPISLEKLRTYVRFRRRVKIVKILPVSLRQAAKQAKVSHSTMWRVEHCKPITLENFRKITRWLRKKVQ